MLSLFKYPLYFPFLINSVFFELRIMMLNMEDPSLQTMEEDVDQLKRTLVRIRAVLADAEEMERRDDTLNHWLQELKGVAFDAEDILGNYDPKTSNPTPPEEVCNSILSPFRDNVASKIKGIRERINRIALQCEALNLREGEGEGMLYAQATVSLVDEVVVYGREDDRKRVVELLVSDRRSELSVIPIVGTGGVGKTTLAQLVYNDPNVCEHFDKRCWVFVSEDFNMVRVMNAITASVSELSSSSTELSHLQTMIKQELEGKRFLLVLDDVWNEDQNLWDSLRASLTVGLQGSVVLVTTRDESVARIMQTVPFYRLECLPEDDCWSLFRQCVLGSSRDPSAHQNLVCIGKGIVKKFRGLPLAAKMVGCLLSSENNEESWHNILNSDLWDSNEIVDVSSPAIALSYYSLPVHLQRCFAYCSLFPKDYLFKKDPIVRFWMAEGFIHPLEGKRAEDVGIEYFDELLRRSFFQCSQINQDTFVMHDLIYNLIESISRKEICRMDDGNLCSVASDTRHLSLIPQDFEAEIRVHSTYEPRALRTFLVIHRLLNTCDVTYISCKDRLHLQIPNDLFINLECLRALDLSEADIVELPNSIGNLKHLRYLGLSHTKIKSLPESLCSLYNLQTLEMRECDDLVELPRDIKNLINLRHLNLPRFGTIVAMPPGIGLLTNLQTLSPFNVGRNIEHCAITELKDLVNLRGELDISGIETVPCVDYAKGALKDKEYLTKLVLRSSARYDMEDLSSYDYSIFGGEVEDFLLSQLFNDEPSLDHEAHACESNLVDDSTEYMAIEEEIVVPKRETEASLRKKNNKIAEGLEEGIFECLQPHTNLAELVIQTHHSVRFPSWMGDPSFSKLISVKLDNCFSCKLLPPLGQLPSLKHLVIEGLSMLKSIGHEFYGHDTNAIVIGFPSLETLNFRYMFSLEEWDGSECGGFPRLHELKLDYCPKLRIMPHLFPSLKKLEMYACDELTVLPTLPSLTELEISCCNEKILSSLSHELLAGLQSLKIHGLKDLMSLPLYNLLAVTELEISSYQGSMNSSFGQQLSYLAILKRLKIHYCHEILFTQDQQLPSTLQFLDILYCPLLMEWCQGHGSSKLVHIPRVILDRKDFHPVTHQTDQELSRTFEQDA